MVSMYIEESSHHPTAHRTIGSLVGRWFLSSYPPLKNGYCTLGCGANYEEGYCNADFFPFNTLRRLLGRVPKPLDWYVDLRHPLKCRDEFFKGIFCEHTFEHLDVWDGKKLLKELHRIIEPGGTLRITVPSLEKYVSYYVGNGAHRNFKQWKVRSEAIWSLTHNWGHQAVYDAELLGKLLTDAGFVDVRECVFREGRDEMLLLDDKARDWETLYMEGTKP
jgi:predicted SAM-dependent methyltransferase